MTFIFFVGWLFPVQILLATADNPLVGQWMRHEIQETLVFHSNQTFQVQFPHLFGWVEMTGYYRIVDGGTFPGIDYKISTLLINGKNSALPGLPQIGAIYKGIFQIQDGMLKLFIEANPSNNRPMAFPSDVSIYVLKK